MSAPVLTVIDIGSNSIKVLVVAPGEPGGPQLQVHFQETLETRISGGLGNDKSKLSETGMAAGLQAIHRLMEMARPFAPTHLRVVATSAVRDAANRAEFATRVEAAVGAPLEILSGDDEARLIARGIQTDPFLGGVQKFCLADLGGGSLECVHYESGDIVQAVSLQLGAVRLTEKFVPDSRGPFTDAARMAVTTETERQLSASGFRFPPGGLLVGTGGAFAVARGILAPDAPFPAKNTARQRRARAQALEQQPPGFLDSKNWPTEMSRAALAKLLDEIAPLPATERIKIPRLTPERADIMPAALTTIIALMDFAHVSRVVHSFHNLRFGVAARFFTEQLGQR